MSGAYDHTARVWDAATGRQVAVFVEGHVNDVMAVALLFPGGPVLSGARTTRSGQGVRAGAVGS